LHERNRDASAKPHRRHRPGSVGACSITGCTFDTGDDCIAIKSGRPDSPGEDVLVAKE
jgi:polygalacturonase